MAALCHKRLMRYFKREWSETRGDAFDSWGSSFWYFETEDSLAVRKQLELYANGVALKYDDAHSADEFGALTNVALALEEVSPYEITATEFSGVWDSTRAFNR